MTAEDLFFGWELSLKGLESVEGGLFKFNAIVTRLFECVCVCVCPFNHPSLSVPRQAVWHQTLH